MGYWAERGKRTDFATAAYTASHAGGGKPGGKAATKAIAAAAIRSGVLAEHPPKGGGPKGAVKGAGARRVDPSGPPAAAKGLDDPPLPAIKASES